VMKSRAAVTTPMTVSYEAGASVPSDQ
jgi:hypothetical protein